MADDLCPILTEAFLKSSWSCVKTLVEALAVFKEEKSRRNVSFFRFNNGEKNSITFDGTSFFFEEFSGVFKSPIDR